MSDITVTKLTSYAFGPDEMFMPADMARDISKLFRRGMKHIDGKNAPPPEPDPGPPPALQEIVRAAELSEAGVLALLLLEGHTPHWEWGSHNCLGDHGREYGERWPCDTVRVIAEYLGVSLED